MGLETFNSVQGQFSDINRSKTYNISGYLIQESPYGDGKLVDYSYDELGRVDTITYDGSLVTSISYYESGSTIKYPDGTTKETTKDALGNILLVKENGSSAISYTYNSFGKPANITTYGSSVNFEYDDYGRQISIDNPNTGVTSFEYDNLGQLLSQVDSRSKTIEFEYDKAGRTSRMETAERETQYSYYSSGANNGKPEGISTNDGIFQTYRYDLSDRPVRVADSIPAENISMVTKFTYDSYGNNTEIEYPSGVTINKIYDNKGYLSEIWHGTEMLWKLNSSNSRGHPVNYNLGSLSNNLQVSFTYDAQGRVSGITTGQKKQTLSFDPASGNLMSRDYRVAGSQTGLTEVFNYDSMNRLIKSKMIGGDSILISFAENGNILEKSDAGNYTYDPSKIHAVTSVSGNPATINQTTQEIDYNSFNLTTGIGEGDSTYQIIYNPLNQRIKTTFSPDNNVTLTTRYYSGSYEKTTNGEVTKELHYISSPFGLVAIIVKQGEAVQTYFVETDHLGSIIGLINQDKSYAESASFDPWGRRRNPADWSYNNVPVPQITERGYTGHEHLDAFGLINMNGRIYDPVLGRFLGVDPVIQDGTYSQSFNGFSYCFNNPLSYVDISGNEAYIIDNSDGQNTALINNFINNLISTNGSLKGIDFVGFEHYSDADIAEIINPILNSLLEDRGGLEAIEKPELNEIIAAATTAAFRLLTHDIPDAMMAFFDFDNIIGFNLIATAGIVGMFKGHDAGKIGIFTGSIRGIGYDVSIGFGVAKIYYSKDVNNLRLRDVEGAAYQLSIGFSVAEIGLMMSERLSKGGYLTGFVGGINFSLPPFSVSGQKSIIKFDY